MVVLFPSSGVVDLVTTGRGGATPRQALLSLLRVVVPFASLDGDGGFRCSFVVGGDSLCVGGCPCLLACWWWLSFLPLVVVMAVPASFSGGNVCPGLR